MIPSLSSIQRYICPQVFEVWNERYQKAPSKLAQAAIKAAIVMYSLVKEMVASLYFGFEKLARSLFYLHAQERVVNKDWLVFKPTADESKIKGHVVLIHGYLHDEGCWTPWVKDLLSAGMAVYIPRLDQFHRHGISDYTQKIRELIERDIEYSTQDASLRRVPIHLMGHSMGGLISCDLAGQKPESFATVSAIGAPLHGAMSLAHLPAFIHPCVRHMTPGHEVTDNIRRELKASRAKFLFFSGEFDFIVPPSSAYSREHLNSHVFVKYCGHLYLMRDEKVRQMAIEQITHFSEWG